MVGKPDDTKIAETPAEKYSAWLKQIFEEAWSKLMSLFSSIGSGAGAKRVQELALTTSIQIVAAIHEAGQVIHPRYSRHPVTGLVRYLND